jgi:hypothetical protein
MSAAWIDNSSQNGQEAGNDYGERQQKADRKPAPPVFEKNVSFHIDAHALAPLRSAPAAVQRALFTW